MEISNNEHHIYFSKISSKTITKRLISEYILLKRILIISIITLILLVMSVMLSLTNINISLNVSLPAIVILYFVYTFIQIYKIDNKKFKQLESYQRQYYILYLMKEILESDTSKKPYKLWSLVRYYLVELHSTLSSFRSQNIFSICDEEYSVRILNEGFKEKILGHVLNNLHEEEIKSIVKKLLDINYLLNNDNHSSKAINNNVVIISLKDSILCELSQIENSNKKIQLIKLNWILDKFSKDYFNIVIIIFFTFIIISAYCLMKTRCGLEYSIDTIFQLLIGTPITVLLFINLIKNKKNE